MTTAIARVLEVGFSVPPAIGFGPHWPLSTAESKNLAKACLACVKSLSKTQKSRATKVLNHYIPWASLVATAYVIVFPRILVEAQMRAMRGRPGAPAAVPSGIPLDARPVVDDILRRATEGR